MSKSLKIVVAAIVIAGGISSVANADGYEYEPVTDYAPPPPVYSWTGSYIGFNAGWIRSESSARRTFAPAGTLADALFPQTFGNDTDGFLAGLTLGYNQRMGASFVGGVEADIAYTDIDPSQTRSTGPVGAGFTSRHTFSSEMQWFGTVRARAGWLASRDLLIYATGGLAYANLEKRVSSDLFNPAGVQTDTALGSGSDWRTGWTVGGGLEWLLGNKTTLKTEYLYYDLGDSSVTAVNTTPPIGNVATYEVENKGHIVRMGLNVAMY